MDKNQYDKLVAEAVAAKIDYDKGSLLMSDAEYDALIASITEVEAEHPEWIDGTSITEVIETTGGDIRHETPMLSLDKVHEDEAAMLRWMQGTGADRFEVQPKYDGMAVSALYENGRLRHLATRGNGEVGEDITYAARQVKGLPRLVMTAERFEVRGEVVMNAVDFAAANKLRAEHGDRPFVNKRNGTVGAMRGAQDRDYDLPTRLFVYDCVLADGSTYEPELLAEFGFITAGTAQITEADLPQALELIEKKRAAGHVDLDGAVVKVADRTLRAKLGATGHHPRWALAYKFAPEEQSTRLLDVMWQVGRTGVITPRAVLEPVFVGGTTITYATLHNPDEVQRMGVMVGDRVLVRRAGDVIPRIEGVLTADRDGKETPIALPTSCPQCGGQIDRSEARWRCENGTACGMGRLIDYATGRDAWDIEGIGGSIARELADVIVRITDILDLPVEKIAALPRRGSDGEPILTKTGKPSVVGRTVAAKIDSQRTAALALPLHRHLTALGMRSTGRRISRALAAHFGSLAALRAASVDELAGVEKIGPIKAATIRAELDRLTDDLDHLEALGVNLSEPRAAQDAPLAGMTVVATGSFTRWDRSGIQEAIENAGGKAGSSVSKNTDLVVAGDKAGSKRAKAESLGVRVIDEDEFAAMLG